MVKLNPASKTCPAFNVGARKSSQTPLSYKKFYQGYIQPLIDYVKWGGTSLVNLERVLKLQKQAARKILNAYFSTPSKYMFDLLKWMPIHKRLLYNEATLTYKALNGLTPEYITNMLTPILRFMVDNLDHRSTAH